MIALVCFVLAVLASPFKSKSRLEAENAALRHQLIVLGRKVEGRAQLTNSDRFPRRRRRRLHHGIDAYRERWAVSRLIEVGAVALAGRKYRFLKCRSPIIR